MFPPRTVRVAIPPSDKLLMSTLAFESVAAAVTVLLPLGDV